jgi:hypothetical protein
MTHGAEQELALLASVADEEEQVTLVRPRVDELEIDLALAAREAEVEELAAAVGPHVDARHA